MKTSITLNSAEIREAVSQFLQGRTKFVVLNVHEPSVSPIYSNYYDQPTGTYDVSIVADVEVK